MRAHAELRSAACALEEEAARVPNARLCNASLSGRPGGRLLPGLLPTNVEVNGPFSRSRPAMPLSQVLSGRGHVRVHVHDSGDDRGPVPGGVQPNGDFPEETSALEHPRVRRVGRIFYVKHPATIYFFPGSDRTGCLRLLGRVHSAMGTQSLRDVDDAGHICAAHNNSHGVPGAHMPRAPDQCAYEDPAAGPAFLQNQQRAFRVQVSN